MSDKLNQFRWSRFGRWIVAVTFSGCLIATTPMFAQDSAQRTNSIPIDADAIAEVMSDTPEPEVAPADAPSGIDLLTLVTRGGAFMIPIGLMSLLVVALAVERMLTLRKRKVMPQNLVDDLNGLLDPIDQFDPGDAYDRCVDHPSPASRVVTAMLMRTGQSLTDIERAASESIEREVDQASSPIRWLTLAAAATPLMGLLGTVWGMIVAFHESTTLTADRSRSEQLSEGIYTALVTTLAGLVVAIPAAILALYLENRLAKLFHRVEQFTFDIAPAIAQFCGRRRLDSSGHVHPFDAQSPPPVDGEATPPAPPTKRKRSSKSKRVV